MKSWGLVLPSYLEKQALPQLLKSLIELGLTDGIIVVVDDSPHELGEEIRSLCEVLPFPQSVNFYFIARAEKKGRGSAIRHGMEFLNQQYPHLLFIIEADTDGSHQPEDILKLIQEDPEWDVVIGSRYLPQSTILGWSLSRRLFSSALNFFVPRILGIKVSDITNGLRRYSAQAVSMMLRFPQTNEGFIYLSEQLLCLKDYRATTKELPITFLNRGTGVSSVTPQLVLESLKGLLILALRERFG